MKYVHIQDSPYISWNGAGITEVRPSPVTHCDRCGQESAWRRAPSAAQLCSSCHRHDDDKEVDANRARLATVKARVDEETWALIVDSLIVATGYNEECSGENIAQRSLSGFLPW